MGLFLMVSIPQAVGTIAIQVVEPEVMEPVVVSIPQAVGTIAIQFKELEFAGEYC